MTIVRTVNGDVTPTDLGVTYLHEHLIIDSPVVADRMPHIHLPSVDEAVSELEECRAAGVGAMVDAMPCASGRDPLRLAEVSRRTGVHIVAVTGLHTPRYYEAHRWALEADATKMADLFVADVMDGIDRYDYTGPVVERTTVRAGVIKVATMGEEITDRDRRVFAAAAEAHIRTGAPILTHCEVGTGAMEQIELLATNRIQLDRVVLSHTDKILDAAYHIDLLESGAWLEYDQALRQSPDDDKGTAWLLSEMIGRGHIDRLMLGTDGARRTLWETLDGSPGLAWLAAGFPEVLDRWGIGSEDVNHLLVTNPATFLGFEEAA